jgi:hypothetical protein
MLESMLSSRPKGKGLKFRFLAALEMTIGRRTHEKDCSGKLALPVFCLITALFLTGCSGGGGDPFSGDSFRYDPGIPLQVTGLKASAGDRVVTLSWNPEYVATSYNIYYTTTLTNGQVDKANATRLPTTTGTSYVLQGLANNTTHYFMVSVQNRDGEGPPSTQTFSTPAPISQADLQGTWYFHTLVSGPSAKWERGTLGIDASGNASFTEFLDSAHHNAVDDSTTPVVPPPGFILTVVDRDTLTMSGAGAWPAFHGSMASRKNMLAGTWTYSIVDGSKAITIFQKKRAANDYDVWDVAGTSSGQNPLFPTLAGNGPTRFVDHTLNSGSNLQWEYCNARVGQRAQFWDPGVTPLFPAGFDSLKDIIYWDYSAPNYKITEQYDSLWKVTAFGVQPDGLIKEYDSYAAIRDASHNVIFTGRITDDKTVVVGVSTKNDIPALSTSTGSITTVADQFYLKILQLNFIPTDQVMPTYTLDDVSGTYKFHKIGAARAGRITNASWAYGLMQANRSGVASFPFYRDSNSLAANPEAFTLAYYPDTGSEGKTWPTFSNFVTPDTGAADAHARYYNPATGLAYVSRWTWWNGITNLTQSGSGVRLIPMSTHYFNEHASLSYNRDLIVMTRTDAFGHSMIIGLK